MAIILAYADTPAGRAARDFAVEETERRGEELIVFPVDGSAPDLQEIGCASAQLGGPAERSRDAVGDLVDLTMGEQITAVVVGVRRRSPVGKILLGSQAQQIILEAGCPVITVKPQA